MIFYARKFVDRHTAEDIVHDIFVKIWNYDSFMIIDQSMGNYLFRSVQNACWDYLKRQTVRDDYISKTIAWLKEEELTYKNNPVDQIIDKEQIETVYKAIDQLPEKCREIFLLSYMEEKKNAEIADMLNISVRTVETQIYKALKSLRNTLKNDR